MKRRKAAPLRVLLDVAPAPWTATGAGRGRKALPTITPARPMTPAAVKRLLVATAAHDARLYYDAERDRGHKVTWQEAIERAVEKTAYQHAKDPKTGRPALLPIFVDDDGVAIVTAAAVERQLFPRTRDRRRPR
jgi:hypothetical protein